MSGAQTGWPFSGIGNIKFGPGVIGRTSTVLLGAAFVFATAIWALQNYPYLVIAALAAFTALLVWFVHKAFHFAHTHPKFSVLDGAELVQFEQLQQAARDPSIIELEAKPVPNSQAPVAIAGKGGQ